MDQDTVVSERLEAGKRLIASLADDGFDVSVAFWAKPTEEDNWFLYLVSPEVDRQGPAVCYRQIHQVMKNLPNLWIAPLEIKVIGGRDSLGHAVLELTHPRTASPGFAIPAQTIPGDLNPTPRPFRGITRFGGTTLGGIRVDGVYIYPPGQTVVQA